MDNKSNKATSSSCPSEEQQSVFGIANDESEARGVLWRHLFKISDSITIHNVKQLGRDVLTFEQTKALSTTPLWCGYTVVQTSS